MRIKMYNKFPIGWPKPQKKAFNKNVSKCIVALPTLKLNLNKTLSNKIKLGHPIIDSYNYINIYTYMILPQIKSFM